MLKATDSPKGFSIVEVLLALVVVGVGLGGLLSAFQSDYRSISLSETRCRATLVAQSLTAYFEREGITEQQLEPAPIPLEAGIGDCGGFTWTLVEKRYLDHGIEYVLTVYNSNIGDMLFPVFQWKESS